MSGTLSDQDVTVTYPDTTLDVIARRIAFNKSFAAYQAVYVAPKKNKVLKIQNRPDMHYADLAAILDATISRLAANGMAFAQDIMISPDHTSVSCVSLIYHELGHVERFGPLSIPCQPNAQSIGSAETYARRYSAQAALGVAADDDDDATLASTSDGHGDRPARVGGSSESSGGGEDRGGKGKAEAVQPPLDAPGRKYLLAANKCPHVAGIDNDGRCMGCGKPLEAPLKEKA